MSERTIQDIIALNQELSACAAAGLPLDLGEAAHQPTHFAGDSSSNSVNSLLDQINMALTLRVGRGQTLEQAVSEEPILPATYRKALLMFLRCDDPRLALDTLAAPVASRRRFASGVSTSLVYPLLVFSIAYVGFLCLCYFTAPKIEAMYRQMEQAPPPALALLISARHSIPIWGLLIPVLIALMVLWWKRRGRTLSWHWIPGGDRYYTASRNASIANQLASMLESGCSLDEALATVFPAPVASTGSVNPTSPKPMGNVPSSGGGEVARSIDASAIDALPPLLQWAMRGDTGEEPLSKVLRFVAMTYQETAKRQDRLWRLLTPTLCGVGLGSLIVLAYGLSLFLPMVQLLKDVATAGSKMGGL